ncbi:MAG: glycosyltransferase [Acidobacteriaceae bacterium]
MRITFFGLTISSSWGNGHATPYRALIRGLHRLGHEVTFYERDVPYYARHRDFDKCDYCDIVLYPSFGTVRPWAQIAAGSSDIVVNASYCSEGAEIAEVMLAADGPIHVYYDLDTPITLGKWKRGEAVEYIRPEQIARFELVLSFTGGRILSQLESGYGARIARPLYGCVDPDTYYRVRSRAEFECDLSYMGTYAADRQEKVETLLMGAARRMEKKKFLLAGSMYPAEMEIPGNVRRLEHVSVEDHAALYSSSQWALNVTRAEMAAWGHCPSGRFFEAAACGTPIVTDEWEGLGDFFDLNSELRVVRAAEDVRHALDMDATERKEMARRARERTLDEHTGDVRARQFIKACEDAASLDLERIKAVYREASL